MSRGDSLRREARKLRERAEAAAELGKPVPVPESTYRAIMRLADEDRELAEIIAADEITHYRWRCSGVAVRQRREHPALATPHPRHQAARARFLELWMEERAHVTGERAGDRLLPLLADRLRDERGALRSGEKVLDLGSLENPDAKPHGWLITWRERATREHLRRYEAAIRDRRDALQPASLARRSDEEPPEPTAEPTAEPITDEGEAAMRFVEIVAALEESHRRAVASMERRARMESRMEMNWRAHGEETTLDD